LAAVLDVKKSCNSLWILSISYKFHKKQTKEHKV